MTIAVQAALLLSTDQDDFDYDHLLDHAQFLVDTRGRHPAGGQNVVKR